MHDRSEIRLSPRNAARESERKAKQALEDAENRRLADVQREKDKAAAEAAALSQHLKDLEYKEKRLAEEAEAKEQARAADEKHRSKIHKAIYLAVLGKCQSDRAAEALVHELIDGKIPHTRIEY